MRAHHAGIGRPTRNSRARERIAVVAAALCLTAPTASAQHPPAFHGPDRPPTTVRAPAFDGDFFPRLREQAQRFEEREARVRQYAEHYAISPQLSRKILDAALAEGLDPDLAFRMIRVESRFQPRARGPQGALGLVQILPSTARRLDPSLRAPEDILDPQTNLRLGFRYLRAHIERFNGDVRLGLLAYNRGETAVRRALREGRDPENGYSHRVLGSRGTNPYRGPGLAIADR
jgi:soluble lytic murein transglycosylase-like protein